MFPQVNDRERDPWVLGCHKNVALRLPNMGLKVSLGSSRGMPCFGCSCGVLVIK